MERVYYFHLHINLDDVFRYYLPFSCSTLSVPSYHATRKKHESWDTARLPKPRKAKSRGRGRIRTTDLPPSRPVCSDTRSVIQILGQNGVKSSTVRRRRKKNKIDVGEMLFVIKFQNFNVCRLDEEKRCLTRLTNQG
ncbi:hypothetical protein T265_05354 [Opisthorchis viverrini]|uniref:Uncharacterized protein n=1 Tax=Opisthorchis viverrini TaxID=6198 RepID=A0A074ZW97_OPIVI|nr:hypothetical protein T265_05354 [Opisthorchis viverrini]KER27635.1 hypothetical protein T265_05354 [Opisthorchis viverrini]